MMTFFPTDGHGFTLIFARALLVLGCIAEDFNLTQTIRNSQTFADCSAPAASGTQSYLTQNSRKSRNRARAALVQASGVLALIIIFYRPRMGTDLHRFSQVVASLCGAFGLFEVKKVHIWGAVALFSLVCSGLEVNGYWLMVNG